MLNRIAAVTLVTLLWISPLPAMAGGYLTSVGEGEALQRWVR